jgi:rhamnose transport system ATP-binding protein
MPEQQMVEIAKAVGGDANIVIMDEPTASLMDEEVDRLFGVIRMLRGRGAGVIYISHRLEEVFAVSDRVTVLRDGETAASSDTAALDKPALIQMMVGRALTDVFPKRPVAPGAVAIELRHPVEPRPRHP